MNIEQDGVFLQGMRQSLEQLNAAEDKLLWQLFLGKKLLDKYPAWADRFLYWEQLNWSLDEITSLDDFLSYLDLVTDTYVRESLRDRMSLLYKKNILWRKGAHVLFESLGYNFSAGPEQFSQPLNFKPLAAIYFDLDYFKAYNQLFGHIGGDLIIKRMARLLLEKYNEDTDMAVRIAGEEIFLLLGRALAPKDLQLLAKNIQKAIQGMMKQLFFDLGQIYDSSFSVDEASTFIEDRLEDHILLNRALDLNSEFDLTYQNKLKADLVHLQNQINNCKDDVSLRRYERKMDLLAEDLQNQRNFDENSDLKKYYYQIRESFFLENSQDEAMLAYFQKYNIKNIDDLSPARFIALLKDLKKALHPRLRTKAKEIYDNLHIYIGGLTMGVLHLDWQEADRYTVVPFSVKKQMENLFKFILLNSGEAALYELTENLLSREDLSYHYLYKFLFENIPDKYLRVTLQILNKYRFDKILNEVTHLEETQKHQKRNEIKFKSTSLAAIENRHLAKERDESKNDKVFQLYQGLKSEIETLLKKNSSLMKYFKRSPVNLWWEKLNNKYVSLSENDELLRQKAVVWNRIFKYRYFDPLLGIFNDQFLLDFENSNYWYARRHAKDYTVVALDFDNLKAVNEAVDHYCGDLVLMKSVLYLNEAFAEWSEKNDLAPVEYPRLLRATPGEEFFIIFSGRSAQEVKVFLDEFTFQITEKVQNDLKELGVFADIQDYLKNKMGKKEHELNQVASFTSGIVNAKDYYQSHLDWDFVNIQRLADKIGEEGKLVEKGKNYFCIDKS